MAEHIRKQGRVTIAQLAEASNDLIDLQAKEVEARAKADLSSELLALEEEGDE